jgi:hypothetical protein
LFFFKSVRTASATVRGGTIDALTLTRQAWQELGLVDIHTEIESNAKAYRQSTEKRKSTSSEADMNAEEEEEEVHVIADY